MRNYYAFYFEDASVAAGLANLSAGFAGAGGALGAGGRHEVEQIDLAHQSVSATAARDLRGRFHVAVLGAQRMQTAPMVRPRHGGCDRRDSGGEQRRCRAIRQHGLVAPRSPPDGRGGSWPAGDDKRHEC